MKVLKERGEYLERKAWLNRDASVLLFSASILGMFSSLVLPSNIPMKAILFYLSALLILPGGTHLQRYLNYKKGVEGEKLVIEALLDLGDDYYLINDVKLGKGNIDHIVLGPNGVFVIETKNYSGKIICNGDVWMRHYEKGWRVNKWGIPYWGPEEDREISSPSMQVKLNALKIKRLIGEKFKGKITWIEGIVVFTNPEVELELRSPTVRVLRIEELCDYISRKESEMRLSQAELESIAECILNLSGENLELDWRIAPMEELIPLPGDG